MTTSPVSRNSSLPIRIGRPLQAVVVGCRLAPPTRMTSAFSSPSPLSCVRAHPRLLSRRSPGLRDGWNRSAALLRPGSERGARSSRADRRLDARARPPLIGFHGRARSVGPYPAGDGEPAGDDRMSVDGAHEPSGRLRPRKPITYDESRHDGSSSRSETSSHPPGPSDSASGLQLTRHQRPSRSPPGRARKATLIGLHGRARSVGPYPSAFLWLHHGDRKLRSLYL